MGNEVRIHAGLKDDVSSGLDKIVDKFDKLGAIGGAQSILQGVGLAAGAAAFNLVGRAIGGVTDALGGAIRGAIDEEKINTRLNQALKANVAGWDGNRDAIDRYIDAQVRLGFQDDDVAASMAKLVAATGDVAKAQSILSTAEDLARFKGISLGDAVDALTKVEAGSYRILKSLGIELKANATQTEALAAVQAVAAGQADAFAKTAAGSMEVFSAKLDQLSDKIGGRLLPFLADLLDKVNAAMDILNQGEQEQGLIQQTKDFVALGLSVDDYKKALAGVLEQKKEMDKGLATQRDEDAIKEIIRILQDQIALENAGALAANDMGTAARKAFQEIVDGADSSKTAFLGAKYELHNYADDMRNSITEARPAIHKSASQIASDLYKTIRSAERDTRHAAYENALAVVGGLRAGYDAVESAAQELKDRMLHPISLSKRIAKLEGQLNGKELAAGLRSSDPLVQEAAKELQKSILDELAALQARANLYGYKTGESYAQGLAKTAKDAKAAALAVAKGVGSVFKATSPPGPESPLHEIDKWGERTMDAYAGGLLKGGPKVKAASIAALSGFAVVASSGAHAASGGGMHTVHHIVDVNVAGGVMTPGAAAALGQALGPHVTKWQQRNQLVPMAGTPQRG